MSTRVIITALLLAVLLPIQAVAADSDEIGDPIMKWKASYEIELDLSVVVRDMLPRLVGTVAEASPDDAQALSRLLDVVGLEALQRLTCEGDEHKDHMSAEFRLTLDPRHAETTLGRLLTTPNGHCEFARYVSRDDVAMFLTIHNLPHYLEVLLDFLTEPRVVDILDGIPVNDDGELDLGGFVPRRDLLPLLAGELDVFVVTDFGGEATSPIAMPLFLVLRSTDGFALRDRIVQILDGAGADAGGDFAAMFASIEPETVGDFELKVLPIGAAIATSADFLVLGMTPGNLRTMLAAENGDLKVPDGIEWLYMNGERYGDVIESIVDMAASMAPDGSKETAWMSDFYDVLYDHLHYEEILYRSHEDGLEGRIVMDGPVLTGLYRMLPTTLDRMPEILAGLESAQEEVSPYHEALRAFDAAMTAYAEDHDETYPEDPRQLEEEGYLTDWPYDGETPPGTYRDWAYTYHTYRDPDGAVVGYLFVLYGEGADYDLYTEDNLASEPFRPARDGRPDGVAGFCYDGTALAIIGEFLGQ